MAESMLGDLRDVKNTMACWGGLQTRARVHIRLLTNLLEDDELKWIQRFVTGHLAEPFVTGHFATGHFATLTEMDLAPS